ncbi:hypothetical protein Hypma_014628 [Hypsizygus marmoreus]|uniref:DDE-1 domain-containing protein n=1 Tax=Hypsizygus marmoreus TaxID=39966 RepID=A0A369JEA9_HYPMA|nr:hypothetical protein Hypma_014628 [Hypsizygus marmoreus]
MADRALPLTRKLLKEKVLALVHATNPDSQLREVSDNWVDRFLASPVCHEVSTHWSSPLAKDRAQAVNPTTLTYWFDAVQKNVVDEHVPVENQYSMDETNLMEGMSRKVCMLGRHGHHVAYKRQGWSRRTITVTEVICADGTVLPPTIIFRGVKLLKSWGLVNPLDANIARAKKGYTNKALNASWLRIFDNLTKDKNNEQRVLYLDPHKSHYSLDFLEYAVSQNITVLGYYPKTTHICQGLDVACFATLKRNYKTEKSNFERHGGHVDGATFLQVFVPVHRKTFTPMTVKATFRRTGLVPFDPSVVVTPQVLAPSKELSTSGHFPIPQPSPVRAVAEAFKTVRSCVKHPGTMSRTIRHTVSAPTTPHINHPTAGLTMTDRAAQMADKLSTTSASFLVSEDNPFTAALCLPPPILPRLPLLPETTWDKVLASPTHKRSRNELEEENRVLRWTLRVLRGKLADGERMLEGQNCQLVLQNLYVEDLREQLNHREKRRKKGHADALLHTNMGQVFTSKEFLEAVKKDEESKAVKEKTADLEAERMRWKAQEKEEIEARHAAMRAE